MYCLLSFALCYSDEYDNEQSYASYPVSVVDDEYIQSIATLVL
jgi:hypothetical protein